MKIYERNEWDFWGKEFLSFNLQKKAQNMNICSNFYQEPTEQKSDNEQSKTARLLSDRQARNASKNNGGYVS